MIAAKLIDHIWATRKIDSLNGMKFMLAEPLDATKIDQRLIVVDNIGAGIGDRVIVAFGSSARNVFDNPQVPVDAAVIGIIDEDCQF